MEMTVYPDAVCLHPIRGEVYIIAPPDLMSDFFHRFPRRANCHSIFCLRVSSFSGVITIKKPS